MSDCYEVTQEFLLKPTVQEMPLVNVAAQVNDFMQMFRNVPSLKQAKKLDIDGKVACGKNVVIKGQLAVKKGEELVMEDGKTYGQ